MKSGNVSVPQIGRGLTALVAVVVACCAELPADTLYNGIRLPEEWPPRNVRPLDRTPMRIPYLEQRPDVVPIDVGRQLFVDDFLIEGDVLRCGGLYAFWVSPDDSGASNSYLGGGGPDYGGVRDLAR